MTKFKGILDIRKSRQGDPEQADIPPPEPPAAAAAAAPARKPRPVGKRSDPAFEQVTAYVRRRTYQQVKIALLEEASGREFSDLVEGLLQDWLTSRR